MFEGAAGGETFQGDGKIDIHLRIAQGEVFIAELKFWDGPTSLEEVVGQLRGRLTWKDSYGVAIILSRNTGFSDVLKAVQDTIPKLAGYITGSLRQVDERHFVATFTIPSDESRSAEIHVLAYNLHVPAPGGRTVRRT